MTSFQNHDDIRNEALAATVVQGVYKTLKALESTRKHSATRWIWELLQNARDVSVDTKPLIASIEQSEKGIVFQHNGADFKPKEIVRLIYHGSTKNTDDETTIGQYGSGFLTTHLLSPTVIVSGKLDEGRYFEFSLKRETSSFYALETQMDKAWNDFKASEKQKSTIKDGFTTRFQYPIDSDEAADAVRRGLEELMRCAPLVMAFNQEFSQIKIQSSGETTSFTKSGAIELQGGLREITVSKNRNNDSKYLLARGEKASVAVPFGVVNNIHEFRLINCIPKLFLGFPLIGTEKFSFPAVINSFEFTPTEARDGVYLKYAENETNPRNRDVIEESCRLLLRLIEFASINGWHNVCTLTIVPDIHEQKWLDIDWIQQTVKYQLLEKIRQTSAVVKNSGDAMKPSEAMLPLADTDDGVEILWGLLNGLYENQEVLPRQEEAVGWCRALKSWATIYKDNASAFDEAIDGRKLAERIDEKTHADDEYGEIKDLQCLLCEDILAIEWLDQLHDFLNKNNLLHEVKEFHIVPAQDGCLDKLSELHCGQDIDEELKDIAELLGWKIRQELRDTQIFSLANESGAGKLSGDDVFEKLITKLKELATTNPDEKIEKASVRLFAWIADKEKWDSLRDYPAFSRQAIAGNHSIVKLGQGEEYGDLPLAPVLAWQEDIKEYADLFPSSYILSDAFFDACQDLDIWQVLCERNFIRNIVTFGKELKKLNFKEVLTVEDLFGDDEQGHETVAPVTVTDIAFLIRNEIGIMSRLPKSQKLARLFWRFLTEWLVEHDTNGLTIKEAQCECGKPHDYYPAKWLAPLASNKWVLLGEKKTSRATAKSLAVLLQGSKEQTILTRSNDQIDTFLDAIGVRRFDLAREILLNDGDSSSVDALFAEILAATGGNVEKLEHALQYAEDLKNDDALPDIIEKRRKNLQTVHQNQQLGKHVEQLVKEAFEAKGFLINYTGIGSDFEIDAGQLEISKKKRKWLVEVKATRSQDVRMTTTQAKESVTKKDGFLLCVVPVKTDDLPELDAIRSNMRFVENIGNRMNPLYKNLKDYNQQRENITVKKPKKSEVQLVVFAGVEHFQVNSSLWEYGLNLTRLVAKLSQQS